MAVDDLTSQQTAPDDVAAAIEARGLAWVYADIADARPAAYT